MDKTESSEYEKSGVSGEGADRSLKSLLEHVLPTQQFNPQFPLPHSIGYFANVIDIGRGDGIAFCTDGVGSKVLVAETVDRYDTIGIDCIAMNVNDLICVGARPVSMVDYIACSFTDERIFSELGQGLKEGARQSGITISGGEISQVPEIVSGIDLIGAAIGHVDLDKVNTGKEVAPGDIIVGLHSSGIHSNGLTLARKVLLGKSKDEQSQNASTFDETLNRSYGEELLVPTRIYVQEILALFAAEVKIKALVHITGGGFLNLTRVEADGVRFVLESLPPPPPVFPLIQDKGQISDAEMHEVFNMGIGFCLILEDLSAAEKVLSLCADHNSFGQIIGRVEKADEKEVVIPDKKIRGFKSRFSPI